MNGLHFSMIKILSPVQSVQSGRRSQSLPTPLCGLLVYNLKLSCLPPQNTSPANRLFPHKPLYRNDRLRTQIRHRQHRTSLPTTQARFAHAKEPCSHVCLDTKPLRPQYNTKRCQRRVLSPTCSGRCWADRYGRNTRFSPRVRICPLISI